MTITEFLLAMIENDENCARAAQPGPPSAADYLLGIVGGSYSDPGDTLLVSPSRALAEAQAKRRLIKWAAQWPLRPPQASEGIAYEDAILRELAAIYADHPDYRQEWAPA